MTLNGHPHDGNTLNISFRNTRSHDLLPLLAGVAAYAGSAMPLRNDVDVASADGDGIARERGLGAVRFSLGRTTTEDDLEYALEQLKKCIGG